MTLETRSFFLGVATVTGLVVLGFGGGILMGGVLSGDNKPNKIERMAAAAKDEKPVQPAVADAKPVPVVEAKPVPVVEAKPVDAATPAAPPAVAQEPHPATQASQPVPQPPIAPPESKTAEAPQLGPEKPVALTQPSTGDQARSVSRREEARIRKEQRRAERAQRREERRRLIAERREREMARREDMRAERMKPRDFEDDDEDERPIAREPVLPRAPDLPFFRIFN